MQPSKENGEEKIKAPEPPKKEITKNKLKTYILVCQTKLNLYRNKKVGLIKKKREEVKAALQQNNLELAKVKMETIIREEDYITICDILGPICEILKEKVTYMLSNDKCPVDLIAPIHNLIYSSSRFEIEDLQKLTEIFGEKYGKAFVEDGNNNNSKLVNPNIIERLQVRPINDTLIMMKLKLLVNELGINFQFNDEYILPVDPSNPTDIQFNPENNNNIPPINPYDSNVFNNNNNGNNFPNPYS